MKCPLIDAPLINPRRFYKSTMFDSPAGAGVQRSGSTNTVLSISCNLNNRTFEKAGKDAAMSMLRFDRSSVRIVLFIQRQAQPQTCMQEGEPKGPIKCTINNSTKGTLQVYLISISPFLIHSIYLCFTHLNNEYL